MIRKKYLSVVMLALVAIYSTFVRSAKADTMDDIISTLSSLTCETQGVGNLLRSEFSHTCIPAPFFNFAVANLLSPGMYASAVLRLKVNDDDLFPEACKRKNRIDPNDPKLSFAFCNNAKLFIARGEAVGKAALAIARAMFTGVDPWDDIKAAWALNKADYHMIYNDKREGDSDIFLDLGIPFPWKVVKENDRLCVATISIFGSWLPVGCKYIREPFPQSIYSSYMDLADDPESTVGNDVMALTKCSNAGGCYMRAKVFSKTGIVMTSPLVECIREMITRLLVSRDVCAFDDINLIVNTAKRENSSLFQFQRNMLRAVTAFLTIYVILFGFKILLASEIPEKGEILTFALKIILVTYFSVGINIHPGSGNDYGRIDGMVQWLFPLMLGASNQIAGWILNSGISDLCRFTGNDYPSGLSYMMLWDALDCRISHYLGLDVLTNLVLENRERSHDFKSFDFFSFSAPPYFYLLIPAVLTGSMTLIQLALMYPLLVISVGAYMLNATVVCMICISILGILAPLFVPMALFEYTKGYFESWIKLMISFVLQPMVVTTFMISMFSVFDFGFYGTCKYSPVSVKSGDRNVRVFFLNNDWSKYAPADIKKCRKSLGFMLNNPLAALFDESQQVANQAISSVTNIDLDTDQTFESYSQKFDIMQAIKGSLGMFFMSYKVIHELIKDLIMAFIIATFTLYLMYNFSAQLSEFAADMTEGVSLGNTTIKAQTIFKAGMKALGGAGKAMKALNAAGAAGGAGQAAGALRSGGLGGGSSGKSENEGGRSSGAADKLSGDHASISHGVHGESGDKISTSGGKANAASDAHHAKFSANPATRSAAAKPAGGVSAEGAKAKTKPASASSSSQHDHAKEARDKASTGHNQSQQEQAKAVGRNDPNASVKMDSKEIEGKLQAVVDKHNISGDANSLNVAELSRYISLSASHPGKQDLLLDRYKAMISQTGSQLQSNEAARKDLSDALGQVLKQHPRSEGFIKANEEALGKFSENRGQEAVGSSSNTSSNTKGASSDRAPKAASWEELKTKLEKERALYSESSTQKITALKFQESELNDKINRVDKSIKEERARGGPNLKDLEEERAHLEVEKRVVGKILEKQAKIDNAVHSLFQVLDEVIERESLNKSDSKNSSQESQDGKSNSKMSGENNNNPLNEGKTK